MQGNPGCPKPLPASLPHVAAPCTRTPPQAAASGNAAALPGALAELAQAKLGAEGRALLAPAALAALQAAEELASTPCMRRDLLVRGWVAGWGQGSRFEVDARAGAVCVPDWLGAAALALGLRTGRAGPQARWSRSTLLPLPLSPPLPLPRPCIHDYGGSLASYSFRAQQTLRCTIGHEDMVSKLSLSTAWPPEVQRSQPVVPHD